MFELSYVQKKWTTILTITALSAYSFGWLQPIFLFELSGVQIKTVIGIIGVGLAVLLLTTKMVIG